VIAVSLRAAAFTNGWRKPAGRALLWLLASAAAFETASP